tara:strand:+ start:868 stop:1671 length:804 start_codon:yes stop_codon:yes gene_type:complete
MNKKELIKNIYKKKSFLCVGLDPDLEKFPSSVLKEDDPIFYFNKKIIDSTKNYCVSYKVNLAFYEKYGVNGLESLRKTIEYIPNDFFVIADAKRGDILNTSKMYADAFYVNFNFDAVTLSPYMGGDCVKPFIRDGKWSIVLIATSNPTADDFQMIKTENGIPLYMEVLNKAKAWGSSENMMFVVGGTRPDIIKKIREQAKDHFLLIPGVGHQGGNLSKIAQYGFNNEVGVLVNCSRSILYAGKGNEFFKYSKKEAERIQKEMSNYLT